MSENCNLAAKHYNKNPKEHKDRANEEVQRPQVSHARLGEMRFGVNMRVSAQHAAQFRIIF